MALSIKQAAPHLSVSVFDPAPANGINCDERASAISAAACRMLHQLGVWGALQSRAQPIHEMIITDSKLHDVIRPVFLSFAKEPGGFGDFGDFGDTYGTGKFRASEPFAHMLENKELIKILNRQAQAQQIAIFHRASVEDFETGSASLTLAIQTEGGISSTQCRLLIAADGIDSRLRERAGIKTLNCSYDQMAIVTTVNHERDHYGRAEEHFLPAGPFAILPLTGRRSSLVWTENTEQCRRLLALDDVHFAFELEKRLGHRLGKLEVCGKKHGFPLGLTLARKFVHHRFALAGDAAHRIHPLAGQGLNFGFKDVAALAETIVDSDRLGMDIGSLATLERYQQWRRYDTVQMGMTMDLLNRLFSNDHTPVRILRDVGLGLVDKIPGLKRYFIYQAAGFSAAMPKLLTGSPI